MPSRKRLGKSNKSVFKTIGRRSSNNNNISFIRSIIFSLFLEGSLYNIQYIQSIDKAEEDMIRKLTKNLRNGLKQ